MDPEQDFWSHLAQNDEDSLQPQPILVFGAFWASQRSCKLIE